MKLQIFTIKNFSSETLITLYLAVITLDYYSQQVFLKECKYI